MLEVNSTEVPTPVSAAAVLLVMLTPTMAEEPAAMVEGLTNPSSPVPAGAPLELLLDELPPDEELLPQCAGPLKHSVLPHAARNARHAAVRPHFIDASDCSTTLIPRLISRPDNEAANTPFSVL